MLEEVTFPHFDLQASHFGIQTGAILQLDGHVIDIARRVLNKAECNNSVIQWSAWQQCEAAQALPVGVTI